MQTNGQNGLSFSLSLSLSLSLSVILSMRLNLKTLNNLVPRSQPSFGLYRFLMEHNLHRVATEKERVR